jgi:hypothetical protein
MPRIEKAFDPGEDPKIVGPWQSIENDLSLVGRLGSAHPYGNHRQIDTARRICERMADLLDAIALNKSIADAYREAASGLPAELRLSEV